VTRSKKCETYYILVYRETVRKTLHSSIAWFQGYSFEALKRTEMNAYEQSNNTWQEITFNLSPGERTVSTEVSRSWLI
jgi:hypothetical protein